MPFFIALRPKELFSCNFIPCNSLEPVEDLSAWEALGVSDQVLKGLRDRGFTNPTPIQNLSLPPAIFHHNDIIGAAETVSSKQQVIIRVKRCPCRILQL